MKSNISICCGICLDEMLSHIIEIISPDAVDSVYTEEKSTGNKKKHFISLKSKAILSKREFADFLSDWIIKNFEQKIMFEILRQNFISLTSGDILVIVKEASGQIDEETHSVYSQIISRQLFEYLSQSNILNIEGFVRFRLREYREQLEILLYDTIDDYLAEKEYEAFIDMLCAYVDVQYPVLDLIHIRENDDGSFSFYDFSQNNISIVCENELRSEMPEALLSNEDKLISILLILIPKRIIWHKRKNDKHSNLLNTIEKIFKDRLSVCDGCNLCEK